MLGRLRNKFKELRRKQREHKENDKMPIQTIKKYASNFGTFLSVIAVLVAIMPAFYKFVDSIGEFVKAIQDAKGKIITLMEDNNKLQVSLAATRNSTETSALYSEEKLEDILDKLHIVEEELGIVSEKVSRILVCGRVAIPSGESEKATESGKGNMTPDSGGDAGQEQESLDEYQILPPPQVGINEMTTKSNVTYDCSSGTCVPSSRRQQNDYHRPAFRLFRW